MTPLTSQIRRVATGRPLHFAAALAAGAVAAVALPVAGGVAIAHPTAAQLTVVSGSAKVAGPELYGGFTVRNEGGRKSPKSHAAVVVVASGGNRLVATVVVPRIASGAHKRLSFVTGVPSNLAAGTHAVDACVFVTPGRTKSLTCRGIGSVQGAGGAGTATTTTAPTGTTTAPTDTTTAPTGTTTAPTGTTTTPTDTTTTTLTTTTTTPTFTTTTVEPDTPTFFPDGLGQYDGTPNNANSTFTSGWWAFEPNTYSATTPETLVVWSHGCDGTAESDLDNLMTGADDAWVNFPFITIFLQGPDAGFDAATETAYPGPACWDPQQDAAKVLLDISQAEQEFNIDPRRIIIAGYSSGGDLSYWTIFNNSDEFAGILAQNTNPWSQDGSASLQSEIDSAGWPFNILQVATQDDGIYHLDACGLAGQPACAEDAGGLGDTHPDPGIAPAFDTLQADGWENDATLLVEPGSHYNGNTCDVNGCYGTYYDIDTYLLDSVGTDGWEAPAPAAGG